MSGKRYTEEFKAEAVKQITERGHPAAEVASRLGVMTHSLYQWIKKYSVSAPERQARQWVPQFIHWYSHEHRHSATRFVTPTQRHHGIDKSLLQRRHVVYQAARQAHPQRWSGAARNWGWIAQVQLNPDRKVNSAMMKEEYIAA
jgi:transposase-like protein